MARKKTADELMAEARKKIAQAKQIEQRDLADIGQKFKTLATEHNIEVDELFTIAQEKLSTISTTAKTTTGNNKSDND